MAVCYNFVMCHVSIVTGTQMLIFTVCSRQFRFIMTRRKEGGESGRLILEKIGRCFPYIIITREDLIRFITTFLHYVQHMMYFLFDTFWLSFRIEDCDRENTCRVSVFVPSQHGSVNWPLCPLAFETGFALAFSRISEPSRMHVLRSRSL